MRNIPAVFKIIPLSIISLIILCAAGCEKTAIQYGEQYVDNGVTNIILVDSISPVVSTIYKDSVITSQTGGLQVGNYNDAYFGKTSAKSFLQLAPPALEDLLLNAQYDSLSLLMKSNGKYYGDSTLPITISVNQLSQEIQFAENQTYFYNTSSFPVNSTPLGTATMQLRPLAGDTARVRLSDAKGAELFDMIRNKSVLLTDNVQFTDYIKGLQISSSSNNNIFGFKDSVIVRLYYHETDIARTDKYFDFTLYNKPLQFNNIIADRTGTPLAALNTQNNELSSAASSNIGYMQSATGIYVKVSFPTIRKLLERTDFIKIIKADLIVRPIVNSYNGFYPLPPTLYGLQTDGANEPGIATATIVNGTAQTNTGNLVLDNIYGANTNYSYDVTAYLQTEINIAGTNKDGLLLLPPAADRFALMNRLVIGDALNAKNKLQLNLYYISVNK